MTNAKNRLFGRKSGPLAWVLLLGLAPAMAGCAEESGQAAEAVRPDPVAIQHGKQIAELQCAQCHQVGPTGDSPNPMAPAFRGIRIRYNFIGFEKRFAEMQADGHYEMPGFQIQASDADDIAAYIDSYRKP